jgi:DNA polymerase-3 subunit delta'
LSFAGWPVERVAAFLTERLATSEHDAQALALMAHGAPGRALALANEGALEIDRTAHEILRDLPGGDDAALLAVADSFRGAEGARRFDLLFERLAEQVRAMATRDAGAGRLSGLDQWAQTWERLNTLPRQVEAVNLDRTDAFWSAMRDLRQAARV